MKLAPEEAHEVIAVLDYALERLNFLAILTPDIITQVPELIRLPNLKLSHTIEEQHELEKRYGELIAERSQLRELPDKSLYKDKQYEIEDVARDLRFVTKTLCRNLSDNPKVADLLKIENERITLCEILQKTRDELNDSFTFEELAAYVESERQRHEQLKAVITQERAASTEIVRTKDELRDDADLRLRERSAQNDEITVAREELQEWKAKTAIDTKYMVKESKAHTACAKRVFAAQETQMDSRIASAQKQLEMEGAVSKDIVSFLESKHEMLQEEIQSWINKYDQDMDEKEKELETLKTNKANNLIRLYELREKYKEVEAEVEREKQRLEQQKAEAQAQTQRNESACVIQRTWRAYAARKLLAAKRKAAQAKAKKAADTKKKGSKDTKASTSGLKSRGGKSPPKRTTTATSSPSKTTKSPAKK